ncbi:MAG TPA: carbamoyltransferase HypF, partial [Patescibacteria group bacterium]|nr:carbamoyltransferase HypF [Patescibacteria group bacterium]
MKSDDLTGKSVVLPPDIGMCEDCLEEFKVKGDPRWGNYEFISCVKCGPRFTIMESLPYDRKRSTMEDFPFCEECNQDYHNFDDRRFHAQTFGCRYCGPFYYIHQGKKPPRYPEPHQIDELIEVLRNGKIAAVKGIGGVNLICRADKVKTIQRLRKKKKERLYKPFAVMVPDISTAKKYCKIEAKNQKWLKSWRRPIVLCPKKAHKSKKFNPKRDEKKENLPDLIAPGLPNIGIILPYMGIHYRIFKKLGNIPLIFTSGNISHLPIAIKNENIVRHLENIADIFYLHNRKIAQRCDDSVIRPVLGVPTPIRRSRGYVPEYIKLPFKTKKNVIVSVGAELNSTGAVSKGNRVFPTQHIGNVRNLETYEFLENSIMHMRKLLKIKDEDIGIIVRDTHPTFQSSKLAQKMKRKFSETGKTDIPIRTVDHHHAHLASLMVDRKLRLKEQIIAITVDGIGFGGDTEPWGGEILRGGYKKYERIGHLRRVPMVGGDLCAKNPARMLLCVLLANPQPRRTNIEQNKHTLKRDYQAQSEKVQKYIEREELWEQFPRKKIEMGYIIKELEKFQNQSHHIPASTDDSKNKSPKQTIARKYPLTSSFGRILDAISSLFGVCQKRTYRGEPAMRLEGYIWKIKSDSFFDLDNYYTKKGVILGDTLIWDYFNLLYTQERFQTEAQKKILARSLVEDLAY